LGNLSKIIGFAPEPVNIETSVDKARINRYSILHVTLKEVLAALLKIVKAR
jgi:hypothetical protein|tara:strand:+ start:489 stop:641 length:153 start_codon:yes stop_codon:yes gene_type:complete